MKVLLASFFVLLLVAAQTAAQKKTVLTLDCGTLTATTTVEGHFTQAEPITLTASAKEGSEPSKYKWEIYGAKIAKGQDTNAVKIDTSESGGFTASVEIETNKQKCLLVIELRRIIADYFPIDQYGKISWSFEKARLDNLVAQLSNYPENYAVITARTTKKSDLNKIRFKLARAKNYLVTQRRIEQAKVIIALDNLFYNNSDISEQTDLHVLPLEAVEICNWWKPISNSDYAKLLKKLKSVENVSSKAKTK